MNKLKKVEIIITGGTIDSTYDGRKDTAVPYEHSILPQYMKGLKLDSNMSFVEICMKDSRDVNGKDRKNVLSSINKSKANFIIVTHGTYTMPDTARYLEANLKRKDQVIVLTGSMVPLSFPYSDAQFNLGYAIASFKTLEPGIYVCMNGQIFIPSEVAKDLSEGKFVSVIGK